MFSDVIWKNKSQKQTQFCHYFVGYKAVIIWLRENKDSISNLENFPDLKIFDSVRNSASAVSFVYRQNKPVYLQLDFSLCMETHKPHSWEEVIVRTLDTSGKKKNKKNQKNPKTKMHTHSKKFHKAFF